MRVLVTFGSKNGGCEGIAKITGEVLAKQGYEVVVAPASRLRSAVHGYDAVVLGGGLYANRWQADARRFVERNIDALRRVPVWMFSSGPLDDSADRAEIPPTNQVAALMERVGAQGHVTFGGCLFDNAKGFPATEMAKKLTRRDFRNPDRIREWAGEVALALPYARPHAVVEPPGRGWPRLIAYGVLGWALCGALMMLLLRALPENAALAIHAIAAPLVFLALTRRYARVRGPREPWVVATTWTALIALLDAGLAGLGLQDFAMFRSALGTWLPFTLVFFVTWLTGFLMSTLPWPKSNKTPPDASLSSAH